MLWDYKVHRLVRLSDDPEFADTVVSSSLVVGLAVEADERSTSNFNSSALPGFAPRIHRI